MARKHEHYKGSLLMTRKPISGKYVFTYHKEKRLARLAAEKARRYGKANPTSYQPQCVIHFYGEDPWQT